MLGNRLLAFVSVIVFSGAAYAGLASSPLGTVVAVPGTDKPVDKGFSSSPMGTRFDVVVPVAKGRARVTKKKGGVIHIVVKGMKGRIILRDRGAKGVAVRTAPGKGHVKFIKPKKGKGLRVAIGKSAKGARALHITRDKGKGLTFSDAN